MSSVFDHRAAGLMSSNGHIGLGGTPPSTNYWLNVPAGTTTTSAMRLHRASDPPTTLECGQLFYTGLLGMDLCGGMRSYMDACIFNQTSPKTIADNPPNAEESLFDGGVGSTVIPAHTLHVGATIRYKNRTSLSGKPNKQTTMRVYVGPSVLTSTLSYGANMVDVYAEIEADIIVESVDPGTGLAQLRVMGRSLYGTGSSGGSPSMRYLHGALANVNTLVANLFDMTFQWSDTNPDPQNTLTTYVNTVHVFD